MNKIEVLRSDISLRNNLINIYKLSEQDILNKKNAILLNELGISNVEIEKQVYDLASENPLISQEKEWENKKIKNNKIKKLSNQIKLDYISNLKNNKPLENNYYDEVRGNVIKLERTPSCYIERISSEDMKKIINGELNTLLKRKNIFIFNDDENFNRKITNVFKGKTFEKGCSMSFWTLYNNKDTFYNNMGLIGFVGDCKKIPHHELENHPEWDIESNTIETTPYLYITTQFHTHFIEAHHNFAHSIPYYRNKVTHRCDRNWMFITLSFTNDGIECYLNGEKVINHKKYYGKNFGIEKRLSILDFITAEDTNLFLGITLDEKKDYNDAFLFDDITFYDEPVKNAEEAMELYQEALTINLP